MNDIRIKGRLALEILNEGRATVRTKVVIDDQIASDDAARARIVALLRGLASLIDPEPTWRGFRAFNADDAAAAAVSGLAGLDDEAVLDVTVVAEGPGGVEAEVERRADNSCVVCGCTDDDCDECIAELGEPCWLVNYDVPGLAAGERLCSRCTGRWEDAGVLERGSILARHRERQQGLAQASPLPSREAWEAVPAEPLRFNGIPVKTDPRVPPGEIRVETYGRERGSYRGCSCGLWRERDIEHKEHARDCPRSPDFDAAAALDQEPLA